MTDFSKYGSSSEATKKYFEWGKGRLWGNQKYDSGIKMDPRIWNENKQQAKTCGELIWEPCCEDGRV